MHCSMSLLMNLGFALNCRLHITPPPPPNVVYAAQHHLYQRVKCHAPQRVGPSRVKTHMVDMTTEFCSMS